MPATPTRPDLPPPSVGGILVSQQTLDGLSTGLALAAPGDLGILYENRRFRTWFPPPDGGVDTLAERLVGLELPALRSRLERGRPFRLETEGASPARPVAVQVQVTGIEVDGNATLLVEAVGIARQKEAEYMLDSYSRMMERQNRALEQEKARAEKLLLNIMPRRVYEELKDFGTTTPQSFPSASVLFLDFVGFTDMAISRDPAALISELNDVFTSFDRIVDHFGCERIKTIGDAYMAVAGVPDPDPDHEHNLARVALRMRRFLEKRNRSLTHRWRCRIGIGSGPVIGSIVGIHKYVYDIFGPAVNLASRLEQRAEPMQILVSQETRARLHDDFVFRPLGEVQVRGFGPQQVFALEDEARKSE